MKTSFVWTVALFMMASCNSAQKNNTQAENEEIKTEETVAPAIAYGTYTGTLPAADCEGIKTTLTINEDKTYKLISEYIGVKDGTFETSGVYNLINNTLIELVTPSSGEKNYYKVLDENQVMLSDKEGTVNDGTLAEHYILKRN